MARSDGIAALGLALLGVAAIYQAGTLPYGVVRNPGPGFVPWWTGVTLLGLSLLLGLQALRSRRAPTPAAARAPARVGALLAALVLYVVALEPLGYPLSTFLLVLVMHRPASRRALLPALGLAVLAAGGSYVLFALWLKVPLPAGSLLR